MTSKHQLDDGEVPPLKSAKFNPVYLRRISTHWPEQWTAFTAAIWLPSDIQRHIDNFVVFTKEWLEIQSAAELELQTSDTRLFVVFKPTFCDRTAEIIRKLDGHTRNFSSSTIDRLSAESIKYSMMNWIDMIFPQVVDAVTQKDHALSIADGAQYADQFKDFLIENGFLFVRVVKNTQPQ